MKLAMEYVRIPSATSSPGTGGGEEEAVDAMKIVCAHVQTVRGVG